MWILSITWFNRGSSEMRDYTSSVDKIATQTTGMNKQMEMIEFGGNIWRHGRSGTQKGGCKIRRERSRWNSNERRQPTGSKIYYFNKKCGRQYRFCKQLISTNFTKYITQWSSYKEYYESSITIVGYYDSTPQHNDPKAKYSSWRLKK